MPFYYFVPVPKLDPAVSDQSGQVELLEWLVREGSSIQPGTPLARARTRWAVVQIEATAPGVVGRLIFDPGAHINVGDPIAVAHADGEKLPYGRPRSTFRVVEVLREKPRKNRGTAHAK